MSSYWEDRGIAAVERYEAACRNQIPEMAKAFERAKKDLKQEIFAFYGRYAKNNGITVAEAQKALNRKELLELKSSLKEFQQLAKSSIGTFNLELENLSMKARLTRLDALMIQVNAHLQRLYQTQKNIIEDTTRAVTVSEYYHTHYDISHETGRLFAFAKIPESFVKQVVEAPVQGADISTRLWRQDVDTGFQIRQTLVRMFAAGRPPQDFAAELGHRIGNLTVDDKGNVTGSGREYEAYRLLYNESSHATGQARLKAYEDMGLDLYQICATLDTHTTPQCQSLDGCIFGLQTGGSVPKEYRKIGSKYREQAYNTDRVIEGVNYPPLHVNCRSVAVPYYEDIDYSDSTRAARDPETGKTIKVPADMDYQEWYETYIENQQEDGTIISKKPPKLTEDEE